MTPKKTTKFHFKIQLVKKPTKRRLFFYDENANDIAEEEEEPSHDAIIVEAAKATANTTTHSSESENSSIITINDDSGCFSSDTSSLKCSSERNREARKSKRLLVTQRTGIDGSFWDINDSNQEAFIAIYVKKSMDESSLKEEQPLQCVCIVNPEELPQEVSTVSVQLGEQFTVRTLGAIRENGKTRKRSTVIQRRNEWKKFKLRQ